MQGVRSILSCTSCRHRKLRCDRSEPCSNCTARRVECVYTPLPRNQIPQRRDARPNLDARVRHLEQLMGTIASQMAPREGLGARPNDQGVKDREAHFEDALRILSPRETGFDLPTTHQQEVKPGRLISSNSQTTYVSGGHWAAIWKEVTEIRETIEQTNPSDQLNFVDQEDPNGPMLLDGLRVLPDLDTILSDIPPRTVADRLVSRYFNSTGPDSIMLHAPTFEQEYKRFWLNAQGVSLPWLATLFSIMFMGSFLCEEAQDELPSTWGNPVDVMNVFHRRSTECLLMSKFSTAPTTYTIEALIMNLHGEFLRYRDGHVGLWSLSAVVIRLAMRMGYHRDAEHYPQISVFHAEMRRRVWSMVVQFDILASYQVGLPSMIQESQCDTRPPSNLLDRDFNMDSVQLPPSRPDTDVTPALYIITKAKILSLFQVIFNRVSLGQIEAYDEILDIDQRLRKARESYPAAFQMTDADSFVIVPVELLMRRYNLELLFQKSKCILHRFHMTKSYKNPEFKYSRSSCVEAAMTILQHQDNIFEEVQIGGRLHRHKSFLSSLEQHDFLLAAMVVCLELCSRARHQTSRSAHGDEQNLAAYSNEGLIQALRNSLSFWEAFKASSSNAQHAFTVLQSMLDNIPKSPTTQNLQNSFTSGNIDIGPQNAREFLDVDEVNPGTGIDFNTPFNASTSPDLLSDWVQATDYTQGMFPDGLGAMLNSPDTINWNMWETYIQSFRTS